MTPRTPTGATPGERRQRALLIALAAVSLVVTLLILLLVVRQRSPQREASGLNASSVSDLHGGVIEPQGDQTPPVLYALPPFELTERSGKKITLDGLKGRVWVAGFVFTTCQGPCPMMTSQMYLLQRRLGESPETAGAYEAGRVGLLTVSVDPERDTPQVLTEYARLAHADASRWLFLTGDRGAVWSLIRDGFKLPVAEDDTNPAMPIMHSQRLVLVDGSGRIRGFYESLDEEARQALWRDVVKVLGEAGTSAR